MENNFDFCLKAMLKFEGGYVNNPSDPGGMTNLGITKNTYQKYLGRTVTEAEMRALTVNIVKPIYKKQYWDAVRGDLLPDGIDFLVFDFGVNAGPFRSVKLLQRVVGIEEDGKITENSIIAINKYIKTYGIDNVITRLSKARLYYYSKLPTFGTFGKGWTARTDKAAEIASSLTKKLEYDLSGM